MELTDFLLARIAEDEAVAEDWPEMLIERPDGGVMMDGRGHPIYAPRSKVLAECAAKRKILELHKPRGVRGGPPYRWVCSVDDGAPVPWEGYVDYPCKTVRLLAAPYADHPDYDQAWRP